MASLQKTYSGDLSTSIAKQLWLARNIAAAAKGEALDVAKAYGVDPMFSRGEFMSRALQMRATSGLPKRFQRQMPSVTMGDPSYLARGQSTPFASPVGPFKPTNAQTMNRLAGQPFPWLAVGAPLSAQRKPASPSVLSQASKTGRAPTTTNTKTREKGVVVKDQQLGNFLAAVALSLSSSLNSINKKMDEANEGIIVAKDGIDLTYKKLEQSSDSLESKLDSIIEALRFSNRQEAVHKDQREISAKKTEQDMETDMSNANRILMQDMDREEIRQMQAEDLADDDRGIPETSQPQNEQQLDLNIPEFAEGGIASGPDSGYLAMLHGDEAVIPLDNNFTQGQPSAVGQVASNVPMLPQAEMGIDNPTTMKPTFRSTVSLATPPTVRSTGGGSNMGENLAKAIELPSKAAGLVTMGLMNRVLKQGNLSPKVISHLKSISAPIAAAFGVPDVMTADLLSDDTGEGREDFSSTGGGKRRRERGLFGRFKDWVTGNTGGTGGVGGRGYGGRGYGGSTYINNRSTGTGGGYGIGGGGGIVESIRNWFGLAKDRDHKVSPDTMMGDTINNMQNWRRRNEQYMELLNQSSNSSEFFTKNVAYSNAFDYKKFESPDYGLKSSEIAYNMSMEDEVNSIIEGLSDPDSQVILNNHTAKANSGKQIEQSAIAVRGNPLKEGTYLSPYSV
tara:strand:- start:6170 stop:8197 length:2028 start_codon:yes stop_codon:yes gene_type:complete